jgi:hypothetical protein
VVPWTLLGALITQGVKLGVQSRGDQIKLFANDQQVAQVRDSTYGSGYLGLLTLGLGGPSSAICEQSGRASGCGTQEGIVLRR